MKVLVLIPRNMQYPFWSRHPWRGTDLFHAGDLTWWSTIFVESHWYTWTCGFFLWGLGFRIFGFSCFFNVCFWWWGGKVLDWRIWMVFSEMSTWHVFVFCVIVCPFYHGESPIIFHQFGRKMFEFFFSNHWTSRSKLDKQLACAHWYELISSWHGNCLGICSHWTQQHLNRQIFRCPKISLTFGWYGNYSLLNTYSIDECLISCWYLQLYIHHFVI